MTDFLARFYTVTISIKLSLWGLLLTGNPVLAGDTLKITSYYGDSVHIREQYFVTGDTEKVKTGPYIANFPNGNLKRRGEYLNGQRTGIWEFFNEQGVLVEKYHYDFSLSILYQEDPSDYFKYFRKENIDTGFLSGLDQFPHFIGGLPQLSDFIRASLKYPTVAQEQGVQGTVIASFYIDVYGNIKNIKILKGIGAGCDDEVIRVIRMMPRWAPALKNGMPFETIFYLPFPFIIR